MTYNTYSQHGPFTNNAGPGIDQSFLNAVEAFLLSGWFDSQITSNGSGVMTSLGQTINGPLKANPTPVVVNGTTSGTCTAYQFLQGTFKGMFVFWNNYRNSTTTEQRLTPPTAFTTYAGFIAFGGVPQTKFFLSNSQLTSKVNTVNTFPSSTDGAGNRSVNTLINGFQYGEIQSGFDQLGLGISQASAQTTSVLFVGI